MLPPLKKKNNMSQCSKCLENNWSFKFEDGMVTATCKNCENEIQFSSRKHKQKRFRGPSKYSAKKLAPIDLHHRYVTRDLPVDRPAHIMPWD